LILLLNSMGHMIKDFEDDANDEKDDGYEDEEKIE
jgi:hypothetical protein